MNEGGRLESRKGWRKGKTTLTGKRKGERPEKKGTQKKKRRGREEKRNKWRQALRLAPKARVADPLLPSIGKSDTKSDTNNF